MKTKIIYISGGEVFDMADVRAAFEEVRAALNLSSDTVLFGVPVDADSAISAHDTRDIRSEADPVAATVAPVADETVSVAAVEIAPVASALVEEVVAPVEDQSVAPVVGMPEEEVAPAPAPKKRTRARKAPKAAARVEVVEPVAEVAPSAPTEEDVPAMTDEEDLSDAPIPILSILASNAAGEDVADTPDMSDGESDVVAEPVSVEDDAVMNVVDVEEVTIEDMITADAPADDGEKTLEELLETMTPLQEDVAPAVAANNEMTVDESVAADSFVDTDATLELLAAEFAQNEDKIGEAPKTAGRGKIGKLKNILPFSDKRRNNNGLMGDLFGWAGIAANDDEFSIPGFFTSAASNNWNPDKKNK